MKTVFKKSLFTVYFANFPYCTAKYNVLSDALRLSQVLNSAGVCGVPAESMVWLKHPVRPGGRAAFPRVSGHLLDSVAWFDTGQMADTHENHLFTTFLLSPGHRRGKEKK